MERGHQHKYESAGREPHIVEGRGWGAARHEVQCGCGGGGAGGTSVVIASSMTAEVRQALRAIAGTSQGDLVCWHGVL